MWSSGPVCSSGPIRSVNLYRNELGIVFKQSPIVFKH